MAAHEEKSYQVGYKKPPRQYQYKKGECGNPGGRPKGSLNASATLAKILSRPVTMRERGRRKTITLLEACLTQLGTKAAAGEFRYIALVMKKLPDVMKFLESQVHQRKTQHQKMIEIADAVDRVLGLKD